MYAFINAEIREDSKKNDFLHVTVVRQGDMNDRGFGLAIFNPGFIKIARDAFATGEKPDFTGLDFEIEETKVPLGATYYRRKTKPVEGGGMTILNEPVLDKNNKPIPYNAIKVHCIFQYAKRPAYYVEGPMRGTQILDQATGKPLMQFVLDDSGCPTKEYMSRWSPEERKNDILARFFMLAPETEQHVDREIEAPKDGVTPNRTADLFSREGETSKKPVEDTSKQPPVEEDPIEG